ncbi:collagen alpha-1(VII) chain [Nematostella vectensis]|uniref:collagen alpha-1(VII) chain n=1 Tax=Nematostella vectensis TaxID=45351 RepID=UPI001390159B|nr:collagen alpha-1(VII) chain [Nematostella vectensis]
MAKTSVVIVVLLTSQLASTYIWERDSTENLYSELQKIPRASVTARKLVQNFMQYDRSLGRVQQNMIFLLDSSLSIGKSGFKRQVYAVRSIIRNCPANSRFAAIGFSTSANVSFNFTSARDADKLLQQFQYIGAMTNTQKALQQAMNMFRGTRSSRWNVINKILLITDGLSTVDQQLTIYRGFQLKRMGVQLFVIAMGTKVYGMPEVLGLVSSVHRHLFRVRDLSQLLLVTWRAEARLKRR